jgi:uncharacterized protein (UPF0332 family)
MINSFEYYITEGKAKKQTPNPAEAAALLKKAKYRIEYSKDKPLDEKTAQFALEDAYEAMREAAQSLMAIKGYKPYSHEATISFIKQYHKNDFTEEEIRKFDRFRQIRNNSVYSATTVTTTDAEACITLSSIIIRKVETLIIK